MSRADNCQKLMKFAHVQFPKQITTTSMHISNLVKIHSDLLKLCPQRKLQMYCGQITLSKMDDLPISNLKADLYNINAMHIPSLVKLYSHLLKLSSRNENTDMSGADNTVENWQNLPISNPKLGIYNINAHTKFGEIHWHLLKLSSGNENCDIFRADISIKNWRNLPIKYPKPGHHNINAHTKFCENLLIFTQVIIRKRTYVRTDGWTHGQPTWYHNTATVSCGGV